MPSLKTDEELRKLARKDLVNIIRINEGAIARLAKAAKSAEETAKNYRIEKEDIESDLTRRLSATISQKEDAEKRLKTEIEQMRSITTSVEAIAAILRPGKTLGEPVYFGNEAARIEDDDDSLLSVLRYIHRLSDGTPF